MFDRVLVANRGEIAVRVIRALHELGIEAVAVYSTADRDALHVRLADQAVCIGPPPAAESYLRISNVVAAAETTGCEAVHPGYGFLAENAGFVRACAENDLVFIGPTADVDGADGRQGAREGRDARGGCAARARHRRRRDRSPRRASRPPSSASRAAQGHRGRRRQGHARSSRSADELEDAFGAASAEAEAAFGDGSLYVEKRARRPRATSRSRCSATPHGGVLTLGERECSIQRRHQKLDRGVAVARARRRRRARRWRRRSSAPARRSATATPARSSSSLGPDGAFYFIEVNCRLQVEHPVSELVTGIDIVREQIRIAAGEPLAVDGPRAAARARDRDPHQRGGSRARTSLPAPGR